MGRPWQQVEEVQQPSARLQQRWVGTLLGQRYRSLPELCLVLLVSLFLLLLVSHTCTGAATDYSYTKNTQQYHTTRLRQRAGNYTNHQKQTLDENNSQQLPSKLHKITHSREYIDQRNYQNSQGSIEGVYDDNIQSEYQSNIEDSLDSKPNTKSLPDRQSQYINPQVTTNQRSSNHTNKSYHKYPRASYSIAIDYRDLFVRSRSPRAAQRKGGISLGGNRNAGNRRRPTPPPPTPASGVPLIRVGIVMPQSQLRKREYQNKIRAAIRVFDGELGDKYQFTYDSFVQEMMVQNPSPTSILATLCDVFLPKNVSAIIYPTTDESFGRNTASSQYFLQLAGYLGIPVIAWNADNSGLEQASMSGLRIQMAPSIHHQAAAMLSILVRYKWHAFTIVTSMIAGHTDFVQTVREQVHQYGDPLDTSKINMKFTIIDSVLITNLSEDMDNIKGSEARIILLYSTREEAKTIMKKAEELQLTGKNFVWIVTQSVVGSDPQNAPKDFPVGMLGVHFETNEEARKKAIVSTIRVFAYGVKKFHQDPRNEELILQPKLSCEGHTAARWPLGSKFYRVLKNVTIRYDQLYEDAGKTGHSNPLEFLSDGTRKDIELKIMNLRKSPTTLTNIWEEIGTWTSMLPEKVYINDIVWPGDQHVPPPGVPEKFHLKIVFLEEPPYIIMASPETVDLETGRCNSNRGALCRIATDEQMKGVNDTMARSNSTYYKCCSGFCIDLLNKISDDLKFTFEMYRVEDGKWGTIEPVKPGEKQSGTYSSRIYRGNTKWNGLVADLLSQKADMALSSFKINSERESVVDFTIPYLESGISLVVAKRTGIISPTAFLEPFDTPSWMLVAFVAIQVSALTIFLFEWLSPDGYNMKVAPPRDHKFSLLRTYWLVWAVLFQAAVPVDCPKGFTARFMANIWAMFAVVFLAIYTANLAAFMITREEYHDFSGLEDARLTNPYSKKPPFKFGFVPYTNAESMIRKGLPEMYKYTRVYNKSTILEGIKEIKKGNQDAFIYDATVLDYLVGQDEDCRLLTVGNWYHMTGYGIGFHRGSKFVAGFDKWLMKYKDNGEIERIQRFWLTGACKPKKQSKRASEPLALEQFLSAYLLLFSGVLLALILLALEHIYFKYLRKHLAKTDSGGCCALISLSMGKSLTFRGAVWEAQDKLRRHRCRDPLCDTHIWKVKHELDMARVKIKQLEKELESHGLKPIQKYLAGSLTTTRTDRELMGSREVFGIRDMTRNHISSTEQLQTLPNLTVVPVSTDTGARQRVDELVEPVYDTPGPDYSLRLQPEGVLHNMRGDDDMIGPDYSLRLQPEGVLQNMREEDFRYQMEKDLLAMKENSFQHRMEASRLSLKYDRLRHQFEAGLLNVKDDNSGFESDLEMDDEIHEMEEFSPTHNDDLLGLDESPSLIEEPHNGFDEFFYTQFLPRPPSNHL